MDLLRAPFPWFGGKSLAAELVWSYLGADIKNYVEPFFGSGAILLNAPPEAEFVSVVNDIDCFVANFWRAIATDPQAVAKHSNNPVNEADLEARHKYLVAHRSAIAQQIKDDPKFFDAELAGWWAWGLCCWIGSGWCAEQSVSKQLPHLGHAGQGVNKKLPRLGNAGRGVNRKTDRDRTIFLEEWYERIASKLERTRVACGDWKRICTPTTMLSFGDCGVILDPPYGTTGEVYAHDSTTVAGDVQKWCIQNGPNPRLRIALCGHLGQHEILEALGWTAKQPNKGGGYQKGDNRERIWFSPGCLTPGIDYSKKREPDRSNPHLAAFLKMN